MIAEKLEGLAQLVRSLARNEVPIDGELVADAIERMLPVIAAMEERPVPPKFRVVRGGRDNAA